MPAFLLADIEVTDPDGYKEYIGGVPATIAAYQGRYLARGGGHEVLEGEWVLRRTVILEFPSMAQAKAWYDSPEYAPLKRIRQRTAKSRIALIEGL